MLKREGLPVPASGLWKQAQAWMPERGGHAVNGGLEGRSERPARGHGQPRATQNDNPTRRTITPGILPSGLSKETSLRHRGFAPFPTPLDWQEQPLHPTEFPEGPQKAWPGTSPATRQNCSEQRRRSASVISPQLTDLSFQLANPHLHFHQFSTKHLLTGLRRRATGRPRNWRTVKRASPFGRAPFGLPSRRRPHGHASHRWRPTSLSTHPGRSHLWARPHRTSHHGCGRPARAWPMAHAWGTRRLNSRTWTPPGHCL
jgi:hypothetical protein